MIVFVRRMRCTCERNTVSMHDDITGITHYGLMYVAEEREREAVKKRVQCENAVLVKK